MELSFRVNRGLGDLLAAPKSWLTARKEPAGCRKRNTERKSASIWAALKPKACLQIQMPRTIRQLWPSRGRVSPAQPPLSRQPNVGKHTHFLLGLHPHKFYLYFASRTASQAGFQNHGPLSSLSCAPLPEQGLPSPLIFIMSGCFCSAPLLPPAKNNDLSKVCLNAAY